MKLGRCRNIVQNIKSWPLDPVRADPIVGAKSHIGSRRYGGETFVHLKFLQNFPYNISAPLVGATLFAAHGALTDPKTL